MHNSQKKVLNILIIDDQKHEREIVKRSLLQSEKNINIHETDNADAAIKMLKDQGSTFDCVFLDYMMPGTDGVAILKAVTDGSPDSFPTPIIMLTGHGDESIVINAIKNGAQDYLSKDNISPATIRIAVTKAMKIHQLKLQHRKAQEQLLQTTKLDAVGQLTGGVAHDFNNLLTIILGNTRLVRKMIDEGIPGVEERIALIEDTAKKGAELVRRLMIFTRQRPVTATVTDIGTIIEQLQKLLEHTLDKTIKIQTILAKDLPSVKIDVGQFENILVNMAINARDAMPFGGTLTLETQAVELDEDYCRLYPNLSSGPYVMIAISDTGTGMAPDIIQKVFDPFFTTKDVDKGTGLGLSMAYGCIREAGGHINVYSEENKGTVFRMYLPPAETPASAAKSGNGKDWAGQGQTVMVVDDDQRLRDMACIMLERMGYIPLAAASGEEALETLSEGQIYIDLVLTDMYMGDDQMNGLELAAKIKALYPATGILLMTGFTEASLSTYELIRDYEIIGKPLFKDQLGSMIKTILEGRNRNKQGERKYGR